MVLSVSTKPAAEEASGLYLDTFTEKVLSAFAGQVPYRAAGEEP